MKIQCPNNTSNLISITDSNGNDVTEELMIREIEILIKARELNEARITIVPEALDIECSPRYFMMADGRKIPVIGLIKENGEQMLFPDCAEPKP